MNDKKKIILIHEQHVDLCDVAYSSVCPASHLSESCVIQDNKQHQPLPFLIHISIVWINVVSCVWLAGQLSCMAKTLMLDLTRNCSTKFVHTWHTNSHHWLQPFYTAFTDLDRAWGHKVSAEQNIVASFSPTLFIWSGWNLMWWRSNLQGKDSVTVINAYAPTSSAVDEKVEQYYDDIERAMAGSDSRYKIITGDFNTTIGTKTKEEDFKSMGAFGIGERNERGDRLIDFAEEHNLIIANILFQKPKNRYWTWESPDGETRIQIEFTLSSQME